MFNNDEELVFEALKYELKQYKNVNLYKCPCCESVIEWEDVNYNPEEHTYTCPNCKAEFDENEMSNITFYDFIEDMFLTYKEKNNGNN